MSSVFHLFFPIAATTDGPPEGFPGQEYQVDRDRRCDDVSSCRRAYEQKECGDYGSRVLGFIEEVILLVESFGILIHATKTCRETPTPAPSHRTHFALSVTQRRSRRSSFAWYALSRSTEPFPSARSWRGTDWTMRDSSKLFEVVYKNEFKLFHVKSIYNTYTF